MASTESPALSVVVIGRNEGDRLVKCLESVLSSHSVSAVPPEIIYVDSNSSDGSPERAAALGVRVISVQPQRPSAALGRNAGWQVAQADTLLFLDGDTLLHPDFISHALTALHDPQVAVVWGHRRELHPEQSLYNRVLDLDWVYAPGESEFCGGDALVRKAVLEQVGGFSEDLIAGEEPELCQRIRAAGYKILHIDQPMTKHDLAITSWQAYWRRAFRAGYAYAEVSQRLAGSAFPLWQSDCRRNARHSVVLVGIAISAIAAAVSLQSLLPLCAMLGLYLGLSLRSAFRAKWKQADPFTLLLYGVHSHIQQIPITVGQLNYWWDRWRQQRRFLIEYK